MSTLLGSVEGALKNAKLFTVDPVPLLDKDDVMIQRAGRSIKKQVFRWKVNFPLPMTTVELDKVILMLTQWGRSDPVALVSRRYLVVWWMTSARPGDASLVTMDNVELIPIPNDLWKLKVGFREGKSIPIRGPYTVHTATRDTWAKWIGQAKGTHLVPPEIRSQVQATTLAAMQIVNAKLEARSVRRGSIQTLSAAKVPEETILAFSGHKSVEMLHRYLDWGWIRGKASDDGFLAARSLA